jgi:hypothetical protein
LGSLWAKYFFRITLAGSRGYVDGSCSIAKVSGVAGTAIGEDGYHKLIDRNFIFADQTNNKIRAVSPLGLLYKDNE